MHLNVPEFTARQLAAIDISRLGQDADRRRPRIGKTTVLVERYRQLVESGVLPREILAITFTEKAAANMKDKMVKSFAAQPEVRRQIEAACIPRRSTVFVNACSRRMPSPPASIRSSPFSTNARDRSAARAVRSKRSTASSANVRPRH